MLHHLPDHGIEVELWHFVRQKEHAEWREVDGISILDLPSRRRVNSFMLSLPRRTQTALRSRWGHVDLVHYHSVFIAENARAASLLRVPYIISPRGGYNRSVLLGRNRLAKKLWLAMHERRYISKASALHAVSQGEVSELAELVPRERIMPIPNGIDERVLDRPLRDPTGKTLLFLGRLAVRHKGIDLLLSAYSEFLEKSGDSSSDLVIAGPDFRNDRAQIEEQIQSLRLQGRVSLPGGVFGDDKWSHLDRAYAFVLTSRWEGMPFALLEALAAGRPVLVTPETNLGSLVEEYGAGLQVSGDVKGITAGIETLLALPQERHIRMRHQARRLIREHFTWERLTRELATHYRHIVGMDR
jgi:glycosyltransferase involved in cell wall biosynthesis